ncbi:MAG: hypothetical protein VKJ24_15425 [Synechococcales bacterium]|nr:hypothetical protein [Synechococcales bacterium]
MLHEQTLVPKFVLTAIADQIENYGNTDQPDPEEQYAIVVDARWLDEMAKLIRFSVSQIEG